MSLTASQEQNIHHEEIREDDNRLAIKLKNKCSNAPKVMQDNMFCYQLELKEISNPVDTGEIIKRFSFGEPNQQMENTCKTILLMGATGSGKTTWINAMINYVLGVEWDDPFRFKLIDEPIRGGSQAHSQTQGVTVYDIYHQNGFPIPFSLTIVDTPGFGDTQGIARDKEITSDIAKFFENEDGIKELDAVGFVVPSSPPRLTHLQKYIFNSILSIFGKDVKENVRFLVTFADGTTPSVLDAILAADLPCRLDSKGLPCYQSFNNGAIYKSPQSANSKRLCMEWKEGIANFKLFFDELSEMPTKSLQMTKEVLGNRKQMELKLQWMQGAILKYLSQMEELRKKETLIELNKAEINANKNYEIKVQVAKNVKESNHLTTLCCTICETTCQNHCDPGVSIWHSEAFNVIPTAAAIVPILGWLAVGTQYVVNKMHDPVCKICKCVSTKHEKGKFRWVSKNVEETQTLQDMKKNYEAAKGKKMNAEQLVKALEKDVYDHKKNIVKEIDKIKDLHNSLKENALRGNPLSTPEYIRMMIENENNERQEGYEERIRNLRELLPFAKMTDDIVDDAARYMEQKFKV